MARPGLVRHRKFLALCRLLKIRKPQAIGHLELMWMGAYESGDPCLGTPEDVEAAAEWLFDDGDHRSEPGAFFDAVMNCGGPGKAGFIEEDPESPGLYIVHDLFDHAPDYVAKRAEREADRKAKGKTLSQIRSEAGKRGAEARWHDSQTVSDQQVNGKRIANGNSCHNLPMANDGTPAPAPAPAPAPNITPKPPLPNGSGSGRPKSRKKRDKLVVPYCPDFEAFWKEFPDVRKTDKPKAFEIWPSAVQSVMIDRMCSGEDAAAFLIRRASEYASSEQGKSKWCRGPCPWLNQAAWNDPPETWLDKNRERTLFQTLEPAEEVRARQQSQFGGKFSPMFSHLEGKQDGNA